MYELHSIAVSILDTIRTFGSNVYYRLNSSIRDLVDEIAPDIISIIGDLVVPDAIYDLKLYQFICGTGIAFMLLIGFASLVKRLVA